jgi:hypothetical protein
LKEVAIEWLSCPERTMLLFPRALSILSRKAVAACCYDRHENNIWNDRNFLPGASETQ